MRGWGIGVGLAMLLAVSGGPASARSGPVIEGDISNPQCRTALAMATAAFRSTHASLKWPSSAPESSESTIAIAMSTEIGDYELREDPAVFERFELKAAKNTTVLWQREARNGARMVVVDQEFNWQGNWYSVYAVDEVLPASKFLEELQASAASGPVFVDNHWTPPVVLRDVRSGDLWVIDQGEPYVVMSDWSIGTMSSGKGASPCRIDFVPDGKLGLRELPRAVQRIAAMADEALGPGVGEGTLQPTARTRLQVRHEWAIASERPWALTDIPYNTREEVDAGLAAWAKGVPARVRLYRAMRDQIPVAERALARYYVAQFGIDADLARRFGAYAIDHMLRSYFTFSSRDSTSERGVARTPWPDEVR